MSSFARWQRGPMSEVLPGGFIAAPWSPRRPQSSPSYPQDTEELTDSFLARLEGVLRALQPTPLRFDLALRIVTELRAAREQIARVQMVARHANEMTGTALDPAWVLDALSSAKWAAVAQEWNPDHV